MFLKKLRAVGFEPTPLSRLAPEASALDHSAKLPKSKSCKEGAPLRTRHTSAKHKSYVS